MNHPFLCAVIKAVDDYQDLLRISVATAGNDHRLGVNEAPPAVVSMFLSDELTAVPEAIEKDAEYEGSSKIQMKPGVDVLPRFNRDTTDRNRASPFAFTGNKSEFRMLGSSNSIACANIMLNAAVAESLRIYANKLESSENYEEALHGIIRHTVSEHKRILFNGNGYDIATKCEELEGALYQVHGIGDAAEQSFMVRDRMIPLMNELRVLCDQAETKTAKAFWPYPSYADILFSVK